MITVVTGLTMAGKSTIAKEMKKQGYHIILKYTTRPMREGEKNGKDYHFVDNETFDTVDFAVIQTFETIYGTWRYGVSKEDLKRGGVLVIGPSGMEKLLETQIPIMSVLLDITWPTICERAIARGDDPKELARRFTSDQIIIDRIRDKMDLILDAKNEISANAGRINGALLDKLRNQEDEGKNIVFMDGGKYYTAQKIDTYEAYQYLKGESGLRPYLRMREKGMPHNPINQIAWLLLQGSGCGFCKVCRDKPCDIKDGEKCTMNIANYIRDLVHEEDKAKQ